jgi:hypothetical protein
VESRKECGWQYGLSNSVSLSTKTTHFKQIDLYIPNINTSTPEI